MGDDLDALLARHHVLVRTDNRFQRRARLHQALWREEQELPVGEHRGRPSGSRLAMPSAESHLTNYLTETIRGVVRREVMDPVRSRGKLYAKPRVFNNLLSSQPLCFNLFGELQQDTDLATRAMRRLTHGRIENVTAIGFEHSPGRGDKRYTGDGSALDVFVEYVARGGGTGFVGIEVKYHEDLTDWPASHRARYDEVADAMKCFDPTAFPRLARRPLQQIWRDHLLAGSLLLDRERGYTDGFFAFTHPRDNHCCVRAVASYRECLTRHTSFVAWTLEEIVESIRAEGGGAWVDALVHRYLAFDTIDERLVVPRTGTIGR